MKVAIIPARGGSKRIPQKNIKNFFGKPIIAWPIEIAKASGLFDRIIVTTDNLEIAEVAKKWGAEVPFIRPKELSTDYISISEVMAHATNSIIKEHKYLKAVCCIYATAPFIEISDLKRGFEAIKSNEWKYAFAATEFASSIFRSFKQNDKDGVEMLFPEYFTSRSQDLPNIFHDAAQFCWGTPDAWIKKVPVFDQYSKPILLPRWQVQDIDTESDWVRAEFIFERILNFKKNSKNIF